jgi:probable rRNA maturation factor
MSAPHIDVVVEAPVWDAVAGLEDLATRAIQATRAETCVALDANSELCVTFCDDAAIRELNAQWRKLDKPTNVLSFPTPGAPEEKILLGDIVVAYETVAREAAEQSKTLADHTTHMILHGFLHLLGYDHETPQDAEAMEAVERRVAASLGMADPYEGTAPVDGHLSGGSDVDKE